MQYKYLILAAGFGKRLKSYIDIPKCLIDFNKEAIITRIIKQIIKFTPSNSDFNITIVIGYKKNLIIDKIHKVFKKNFAEKINFVYNPFYDRSNNICSVWMARNFINNNHDNDKIIIINSDMFVSDEIFQKIYTNETKSFCLVDSTVKNGDYCFQQDCGLITFMGKNLRSNDGEYLGFNVFNSADVYNFIQHINIAVEEGLLDSWFEDIYVKMIINKQLYMSYIDIKDCGFWAEIDTMEDILKIKQYLCI